MFSTISEYEYCEWCEPLGKLKKTIYLRNLVIIGADSVSEKSNGLILTICPLQLQKCD